MGAMSLASIFGRNTLHHKIALRIAELKCDVGKRNAFFGGDRDHRQHENNLTELSKMEDSFFLPVVDSNCQVLFPKGSWIPGFMIHGL